ncbi:hypothetical protein ACFWA9_27360 [Kitasatospora sp. NPDC059973]|uniref:hypothetical protein n=1 Tax=Kitasatospora sp. NPDC059973 TaxID=3347020 RepID=UPI0036AF2E77
MAARLAVSPWSHPDPALADDHLDLAEQLLTGLDLRATTLTTCIAALIRDAGTPGNGLQDRADVLDAEIRTAGLRTAQATLALALCFHHAVLDSEADLAAAILRPDQLTRGRDYAYYVDIAHFMAGRPLDHASPARWLDGEHDVRGRWRTLVSSRRESAPSAR